MAAGQALDLSPPAPAVPTVPTPGDPAMAALLACLHQDPRQLSAGQLLALDDEHWRRLLTLTAAHRVRGLVGRRLTDASVAMHVPADVRHTLSEAARRTAARMLRARVQVTELASAFADASIPVIALKGAHLAQVVYPDLTLRDMEDIDLLVPREHLQRATDIALMLGYAPIRPFTVEQEVAAKLHIVPLARPGSLNIEIHWTITPPNEVYSIDPADLWTHAVPIEFDTCRMLGLSAEHLLLHLCVHASYHHGFEFGIRSLVDIAATIRCFGQELDWAILERQCRTWHWQRGVGVSFSLARDVLGAAVPSRVLDSLAADTDGAAIDRDVVDVARAQILGEPHTYAESHYFAQLRTLPGFWPKTKQAWDRVFLPRSEMARLHARSHSLGSTAALYAVRVCTLIGRYAQRTVGLLDRRPALQEPAERRQRLRRWLSER